MDDNNATPSLGCILRVLANQKTKSLHSDRRRGRQVDFLR